MHAGSILGCIPGWRAIEFRLCNVGLLGPRTRVVGKAVRRLEGAVQRTQRETTVVKLAGFLESSHICLNLEATDKAGIINEIAVCLEEVEGMKNFKAFLKDVFRREEVATTGIGEGIAIPHARTDAVDSFVMAFGRSVGGVDFQALDSQPCKLFFLLGTPKDQVPQYLQILAHLTRLLKSKEFCEGLLNAQSAEDVIGVFLEAEQ